MKKLTKIIMSGVLTTTMTAIAVPAFAQDSPDHFFVERTELHPTKIDSYMEGWKTVLKHADEHDYKYVTLMSKSGPRVSTVTAMSNYSDLDAIMDERNRVYEAGGRDFERAIDKMNAATHSEMNFTVKHMPDISNQPTSEQAQEFNMFELGRAMIQPGKSGEFEDIMVKYKKAIDDAGLSGEVYYNVYSGGIGSGGGYYFQTFAKDPAHLAEVNMKTNAMFKDNEDLQDLFDDYLALETPGSFSSSDDWMMLKDMAFFPEY